MRSFEDHLADAIGQGLEKDLSRHGKHLTQEKRRKRKETAVAVTCGVLAFASGFVGSFWLTTSHFSHAESDYTPAIEEPVEALETPPTVFEYYGKQYREEVDTDGYIGLVPVTQAVDPLEAEKVAIAKTVWGEARGCDVSGQESVVWCVLDRYDDGSFGDSIIEVVSKPYQFQGYRESNPVEEEIMSVVDGVVNRWLSGEKGPGYLYFEGDGKENHFREEW